MSKPGMHNKGLITAFLLIVIGLALTPTIQNNVDYVTSIDDTDRPGYSNVENSTGIIGDNLTRGAARTTMLMVPLFWVILMILIPAYYVGKWLKG